MSYCSRHNVAVSSHKIKSVRLHALHFTRSPPLLILFAVRTIRTITIVKPVP